MGKSAVRLYKQFQPDEYDLHLHLNREKMQFSGTVVIHGQKTGRPAQRLTFHQKDLKIKSATVIQHTKTGDKEIVVDRINHHATLYEVRLHTVTNLYPGAYTIRMEFEGLISQNMLGIYPSYFETDGQKQVLIATQFESHHAREAFPCIDEPEAKAVFHLSLNTEAGAEVLSNTPIAKQKKLVEDRLETRFEPTPRMSTYLLAFVYGNMQYVEGKTKSGTIVRTWSSTAQPKDSLKYSVQEAIKILDFFTDYFGVTYPLPKCDQVALPDFDAGAMENWGLITYREIALLADAHNRSISNEQYVSLVVAHELSHQWFGDLVTMEWWDDLWLNESFASLMEHLALDAIHPDWYQWEYYTASDVISTSSRDVYKDIQPVSVKVTDPDLIDTLFDPGIVYAKGARLLKMLREYIGDKAFRQGLQAYFKKHAYGNATRADLWKALSEACGQNIDTLMTPWITRPGMPILEVKPLQSTLQIKQERFLLDGPADGTVWPVPLLTNQRVEPNLIQKSQTEVKIAQPNRTLLNQSGSGHYFVHYVDAEHRAFLNREVQAKSIPPEARINFLNDIYMLARHGDASLTDGLDIVKGCAGEDRDNVWAAMSRIISAASLLTEGSKKTEDQLKTFRQYLAQDWYTKLGWLDKPKDDPNTKQLRHTAVAYMTSGDNKDAIAQALTYYNSAEDLQAIPAEIRATILSVAVKHGNAAVVDRLLKAYPGELPDIQLDIVSALASTKKMPVAEKMYQQALGPNGFVRAQDVMRWLALFFRNYRIRPVAWSFLQNNWEWLETTFAHSKSFDYLPLYSASAITTHQEAKQYHEFFEPHRKNKTLAQNIAVGSADIAAKVAWRERDEAKLKQWLRSNT